MGFIMVRQKGSHMFLRRGASGCVVPNHKDLRVGTLSGILKQAGVSLDEFMKNL
jgi:predicted RNA binding protein YcfA (HicA-like mRNA interferase family)